MALVVKNPSAKVGDVRVMSSIPGSGRSPGEGHGNPLQNSGLENPMDRGAWQGRTESDTTEVTLHSTVAIGPVGFSGLIIRDYATKSRLVN